MKVNKIIINYFLKRKERKGRDFLQINQGLSDHDKKRGILLSK